MLEFLLTFFNIGHRYSSQQQQNNYQLLQEAVKIKQGKEQTSTTRREFGTETNFGHSVRVSVRLTG